MGLDWRRKRGSQELGGRLLALLEHQWAMGLSPQHGDRLHTGCQDWVRWPSAGRQAQPGHSGEVRSPFRWSRDWSQNAPRCGSGHSGWDVSWRRCQFTKTGERGEKVRKKALVWPSGLKSFLAWPHVLLSHVWLSVTLWTVARQAPLSTGFFRRKHWSGVPFPPPGIHVSYSSCFAGRFFIP